LRYGAVTRSDSLRGEGVPRAPWDCSEWTDKHLVDSPRLSVDGHPFDDHGPGAIVIGGRASAVQAEPWRAPMHFPLPMMIGLSHAI
jgi:hypothetical protein